MIGRSIYIITVILFMVAGGLRAQHSRSDLADTAKTDKVNIDYSDTFEMIRAENQSLIRKLTGNVKLSQDSIYMDCDSAIISMSDTRVQATGNVVIQQGDSLVVFADSLIYSGISRLANLYGNVVLRNGGQELFTDSLHYDLNSKIATYTSGATLINGETQLTSRRGYYYVNSDEAFFKDSVIVIDPEFNLKADTLMFNARTEVVTFLGPTLIGNDSTKIYTEAGYYDTANRLAEFTKNAQYVRGAQKARARKIVYDGADQEYSLIGNAWFVEGGRRATADTIRYDEGNDKTFLAGNAHYEDEEQEINSPLIIYDAKDKVYSTRGRARMNNPPQFLEADMIDFSEKYGLGVAEGNVLWRDTSANLTIRCSHADYNRETEYLKAVGGPYGRPMLITAIDGDSLFLASDTLVALRDDTLRVDSSRLLLAYHDVRIFKSDMQGLCDSLAYVSQDSIFQLFGDPIMWSDTSQFMADSIRMEMRDGSIDKIHLVNKALIINSPDEIFFNQIKGKSIIAFFRNGNIDHMDVAGNAESIYYARDEENAYVGVNETVCSEMTIFWGDNQVERIRFLTQPTGTAHPMGEVNHGEMRLEGFHWWKEKRPRSILDLFGPPRWERSPAASGNLSLKPEQ